jgi:hypothetical protein
VLLGAIEPKKKQEKGTRNLLAQVSLMEEHRKGVFTIGGAQESCAAIVRFFGASLTSMRYRVRESIVYSSIW